MNILRMYKNCGFETCLTNCFRFKLNSSSSFGIINEFELLRKKERKTNLQEFADFFP